MQDNPSANERRLAITHRFAIRVPSAETEAVQQKHMAECVKLGCTILGTSIDRSNEGRISARASVRIKPDSHEAFAAVLAAPPAQINALISTLVAIVPWLPVIALIWWAARRLAR
jgi:hypothetical protein